MDRIKPNVVLLYDALCNGQSCGLTTTYLSTYLLSALLNGQAVGNLFAFDLGTGKSTFTPTVRLPEGSNSFTAQVTDRFGHLSNTVGATFTIDTIPPKFIGLAPPDGSVFFTPQVTVTGKIDEPGQVLVENLADFAGTGVNPAGDNFRFGLTLNPGINSIRLRANDLAGNITNKTLQLTFSPGIAIAIDSPVGGAVINGNSVIVTGTIQGASNPGITVNGILAAVNGNHFYANVPLQPGNNVLTVTGSAPEVESMTKTVTVTGISSPFQVSAFPQNGIAPHPVNFNIFSSTGNSIARIDVNFNGSGTTNFTTTDPNAAIQTTYAAPGVYQPRVTITDSQGKTYSFTQVVVVANVTTLDAKLQGIYAGMLARLKGGDIEGALKSFTPSAVEIYRPVFQALQPIIASVVDRLGTIADGTIAEHFAEYVLVRNTPQGKQAFLMYFSQGSDGIWLISQM